MKWNVLLKKYKPKQVKKVNIWFIVELTAKKKCITHKQNEVIITKFKTFFEAT